MPTVKRVFAALAASKQVPQFIKLCYVILGKMSPSATFSKPPIPYSDVENDIEALEKAEQLAHHGPKGAAQDRNVKLGKVRNDMRQLKEYVQAVADAAGADAAAVIESAGMTVSKRPERAKAPFGARKGAIPGRVRLDVKAVKGRVTYYWQMSKDQVTWTTLPDTQYATTTIDGLTPGVVYFFRFRTLTKEGLPDWSSVISILAQ